MRNMEAPMTDADLAPEVGPSQIDATARLVLTIGFPPNSGQFPQ